MITLNLFTFMQYTGTMHFYQSKNDKGNHDFY